MPCLTGDKLPRYRATVWITGSEIFGISTARHAHQGAVKEVCRRALSFTSSAVVVYNEDGSVPIDARRVIDDKLRAGMRAEVAMSGRFDHWWLVHYTLKDMSCLRDRRGKAYSLNGADFAMSLNYFGEHCLGRPCRVALSCSLPRVIWQPSLWQSDGIWFLLPRPSLQFSVPRISGSRTWIFNCLLNEGAPVS